MSEFKFPSEEIELPSKGLVYPKDNPLSSGKVEVKYMSAKEEDILTNQSYIKKGTVLDKLLESVLVDKKINVKDLILGDKNALLIATRILGYGAKYEFLKLGNVHVVDLTDIENTEFSKKDIVNVGVNEFPFTLPHSKANITYKILDGHDESKIDREIKGLEKINKNNVPALSTRLKYIITSVEGDSERKTVREFVDKHLLAIDSRALRDEIRAKQPDVNLELTDDAGEEVVIPIGVNFFWPELG
tara:strand:+ start:291 stop:1025 length:735 start_codon:yes stop_codon:yes gene_type:complete